VNFCLIKLQIMYIDFSFSNINETSHRAEKRLRKSSLPIPAFPKQRAHWFMNEISCLAEVFVCLC